MARTTSLNRPRAPVSAITAAVIVGEKLTTMSAPSAAAARRCRPVTSVDAPRNGQPIHAIASSTPMATASVVAVMRVIDAKRCPSRSKLSDSPAIRAITVVASP